MDDFIESIKSMARGYGCEVSDLSASFAIEKFSEIRFYPDSWSDERRLEDMMRRKSTIAMAAIEIESKNGAEGQTKMSENGISRTWADHIMAYRDVIGFANCL